LYTEGHPSHYIDMRGRLPGHLPRGHDRVKPFDWAQLDASDRRSRRFRQPPDDYVGALERGLDGDPTGGGAVNFWTPEHDRRQ
jgi:hypothetical protein